MNEDINNDGTLLTIDINDTDSFSSIKVKILSQIKNIREKEKRPDSNAIFEDLLKTDSTITEKSLLHNALSKLIDLKLVINKKKPFELLLQSVTFLQCELRSKDEIIKTQLETDSLRHCFKKKGHQTLRVMKKCNCNR